MGEPLHVVVVTGLSGSGKSTAINVLEDLGFYCIDNLPAVLVPNVLELCQRLGEGITQVGLGIDLRERAFFHELPQLISSARQDGHRVDILFLDAADDVLVRRFSESRRPHPLAKGGVLVDGIRRERHELETIREMADRILDTTALTVHQLREELAQAYPGPSSEARWTMSVVSFGYKFGVPTDADMVLDVRFLPNPFFVEELRDRTGRDPDVARYVRDREEAQDFLARTMDLLSFLIPRYRREGKSYFTLAIGCTGGRHRSVVLTEEIVRRLVEIGSPARIRHRDLER